jgi:hypothetical protein
MKGKMLIGASVLAALAFVLVPTAVRADAATWIDDITAAVMFEKGANPEANFEPYLGQMQVVRAIYNSGDHHAIHASMNRLMDMLEAREGGIPAKAADELYNYCNLVTPAGFHDVSRHEGRMSFEPEKAPLTESYMKWDEYGEVWFKEQ